MATALIVPALRLRRATTGWSYRVPPRTRVQPGSLVIVPFRNRPTLGIVWELTDDSKAREFIAETLTATPLVRAPHRQLIEWIAEEGITSLSTALYAWLPAALRELPLTKPVREALAAWDTTQPDAKAIARAKQHAVLTPSHRAGAEAQLARKYGSQFHSSFQDATPAQEFAAWLAVARGKYTVVTGRERALFAPWLNLRHVTVIEPEDISFHTGQSPRLDLVAGTTALAQATGAVRTLRTNVPVEAGRLLWGADTAGLPLQPTQVELTDLRHERLLNQGLLEAIRGALDQNKHVILLYNAHDRTYRKEDGERVILPGIETVRTQLIAALGYPALPQQVHLGTRSILSDLPRPVGLTAVLSLDPLLAQTGLTDQIHGWGDLGKLLQLGVPLHVQSRDPGHPLCQALLTGSFTNYCVTILQEAQAAGLPPFATEVACATSKAAKPTPEALTSLLQKTAPAPWRVSHPRTAHRRGKPVTLVTLHAPAGTRLPLALRKPLAALTRPWQVERNPWYAS